MSLPQEFVVKQYIFDARTIAHKFRLGVHLDGTSFGESTDIFIASAPRAGISAYLPLQARGGSSKQ